MNDRQLRLSTGWTALWVLAFGLGLIGMLIAIGVVSVLPAMLWVIIPLSAIWFICLFGFIVVNPNEACVVQLFGNYLGTINEVGFYYGNPFYSRTKVSLRIRTFETGVQEKEEVKDATGKVLQQATQSRRPLKVNDKDGTPIEIAAVVVWKVVDAAQAVFQVDDYESYVHTQADAALRNLASHYRYDAPEEDESSLRGHIEQVAEKLKQELHQRMYQAGVAIQDARISYLAYAPEIAAAMLQRQQASATIAARKLIVDAAVSMVEHALDELNKRKVVDLDDERRAAMVSNLLVVLCGHHNAQPVVNTGTLYS
ncbi:MAG TPA: SPFH domain-containing protein [Gemmatales bacterium]|nr:SPFH domain-containing protein [Gemmatales bacterium]